MTTTPPAAMASADSLALPAELRNIIYDQYPNDLEIRCRLPLKLPTYTGRLGDFQRRKQIPLPGLALANHQISAEFLSSIFAGSNFRQCYAWYDNTIPSGDWRRGPPRQSPVAVLCHGAMTANETTSNGLVRALNVKSTLLSGNQVPFGGRTSLLKIDWRTILRISSRPSCLRPNAKELLRKGVFWLSTSMRFLVSASTSILGAHFAGTFCS